MPEYSAINQIGDIAEDKVRSLFKIEKRWIFRSSTSANDYGIDGEIEIVDENKVTGKLVKCQVKGQEKTEFEKGTCRVQVKTSTWNNWYNHQVPVVALLCDINSGDIYWCLPLKSEPKKDAKTVGLKFPKSNCLTSNFTEFEAVLNSWINYFPSKNILLSLPYYHNLFYNKMVENANWADPGTLLSEQDHAETKLFYHHTLQLRLSVGLRIDSVFSFSEWMIRNQGMWGDGVNLCYGTYDELIHYLRPYYEEAIEKIKSRLKRIELNLDYGEIMKSIRENQIITEKSHLKLNIQYPETSNNDDSLLGVYQKFELIDLINYFELSPLLKNSSNISLDFIHPKSKSELFHKKIEEALESKGFNRYKWHNNY